MANDSILLVEHEYQDRLAWTDFLENRGYNIQAVGDGTLAMDRMKNNEFDLIIANDQVPGLDGAEIVRKIDGKIPVILVSSSATVDQAVEAMKSGARDFILKPVSAQILGAVVGGFWAFPSPMEPQIREHLSRHNNHPGRTDETVSGGGGIRGRQ